MRQKTALFVLISLVVCQPTVFAGPEKSKELPAAKSYDKMPVVVGPRDMKGYEEIKRALDESLRAPSLKEMLFEVADKVKKMVEGRTDKSEADEKKAKDKEKDKKKTPKVDPKTDCKAHQDPAPIPPNVVIAPIPVSSDVIASDSGALQVNYSYGDPTPTNPYDKVIVMYDPVTGVPVSATGYKTTYLNTVPDLSGMTLVSSTIRSDGSLASKRYQSPVVNGGYTLVVINYQLDGTATPVTQTTVQALNLTQSQLPALP